MALPIDPKLQQALAEFVSGIAGAAADAAFEEVQQRVKAGAAEVDRRISKARKRVKKKATVIREDDTKDCIDAEWEETPPRRR